MNKILTEKKLRPKHHQGCLINSTTAGKRKAGTSTCIPQPRFPRLQGKLASHGNDRLLGHSTALKDLINKDSTEDTKKRQTKLS